MSLIEAIVTSPPEPRMTGEERIHARKLKKMDEVVSLFGHAISPGECTILCDLFTAVWETREWSDKHLGSGTRKQKWHRSGGRSYCQRIEKALAEFVDRNFLLSETKPCPPSSVQDPLRTLLEASMEQRWTYSPRARLTSLETPSGADQDDLVRCWYVFGQAVLPELVDTCLSVYRKLVEIDKRLQFLRHHDSPANNEKWSDFYRQKGMSKARDHFLKNLVHCLSWNCLCSYPMAYKNPEIKLIELLSALQLGNQISDLQQRVASLSASLPKVTMTKSVLESVRDLGFNQGVIERYFAVYANQSNWYNFGATKFKLDVEAEGATGQTQIRIAKADKAL